MRIGTCSSDVCSSDLAAFGQSRHAALEAMAVDVAKAWQRDAVALVPGFRHGSGLDRGDPAVGDAQPHVLFPAITDPRAFEPERSHHHSSILCLDIMAHRGRSEEHTSELQSLMR